MSEGGDGGRVDSLWNVANLRQLRSISHYYGDSTRQFLIAAAVLMLVASPFYGDNFRVEFPLEVMSVLIIIACAALINPKAAFAFVGSTLISGVGAGVYAMWGVLAYDTINPIAFALRIAISILFLSAFYFSLKTLRAFMLRQIGKRETVDEFESDEEKARTNELEEERMQTRPEDVR
ncbi:hypothetical protein COU18_01735 [Candidatus Kaiserbacteria bacterium CG10_big_fil_rev_8_21_14_0_10_51_14]|uniref:Uncharacterized protein n=1 Tax=Candidatus Kaiserbacteria bacterium CG10_big_fil_rev_8_21_14_0_10_51_14 TaxID=1974610 RepID=A0A2H0UCF8_9BACT|nr:MAG: hypothetical protein COU18_01735 [Candidatus Kaiserbacteria bacterium CG10_big_fil_rev_8_21_14_0_10_51_14]